MVYNDESCVESDRDLIAHDSRMAFIKLHRPKGLILGGFYYSLRLKYRK